VRREDPRLAEKIVRFECSLPENRISSGDLLDACGRYCRESGRKDLEALPEYMVGKADRMLAAGALRDTIDVLWTAMGLSEPIPANREMSLLHLRAWHRQVGWAGSTELVEKLRIVESLWTEIKDLAAERSHCAGERAM
jgi:hypothetical protein